MNFDLKTPCKNCPFRTDTTAIRFSCRERAEEIEEQAYGRGFPCHLSAVLIEDEDGEYGGGGYVPGENTQHCIGYVIMRLKSYDGPWPGIDNDEEIINRLEDQIDWNAPVFDNDEDFFRANERPQGAKE